MTFTSNSSKMYATILLSAFFLITANAQTIISGNVTEKKGSPIEGANVFLDGSYDGVATDALGNFSFETEETGPQLIKVTFLSFEEYSFFGDVKILKNLKITKVQTTIVLLLLVSLA